tara:strand:- start:321 stop:530 length:210 start_codon:yes stop_codon:yes gene_type:complete
MNAVPILFARSRSRRRVVVFAGGVVAVAFVVVVESSRAIRSRRSRLVSKIAMKDDLLRRWRSIVFYSFS